MALSTAGLGGGEFNGEFRLGSGHLGGVFNLGGSDGQVVELDAKASGVGGVPIAYASATSVLCRFPEGYNTTLT